MSNPQLMEQAMQMQGAMGGMGAFGGMGGGMPGATPSATSPGAQQARSPPMMNPLLQQMMMGGMPGMGGAPAAPAVPQDPPEVRFQVQLQQMQEMGFYDAAANIRALLACGGNVQAALEFMFSQ